MLIEAHVNNAGPVYFADIEAKASTNNRHRLSPGEKIALSVDMYANLIPSIRISDFWGDADNNDDRFVVSYLENEFEPGGE